MRIHTEELRKRRAAMYRDPMYLMYLENLRRNIF